MNRESAVPLYLQVIAYVRENIRTGRWGVGSKLPSQRKLAEALHVNRSTISIAFDELAAQGLISSTYGGGTRVINNTWGLLTNKQPTNWQAFIESGTYKPNLKIIQQINAAEFQPDVIRMGTGELTPELLPHDQLATIFAHNDTHPLSLGYSESKGEQCLREEVAKYVRTIGIDVTPSSILIVSGALQALQLISIGLLDYGSTLLLEKPSYLYSVNVFQSLGMRFIGLESDVNGICVDQIAAYKKKYKSSIIYTIPNFHNPTGRLMSNKRREELLSVAIHERLPIIEDDVYRDLWLDNPPPIPLKAIDHLDDVIYLGSLSKALSPGLRIGWIIGPEAVIERLADLKMQSDYGSSAISQWLAYEFLKTGAYEAHVSFVREKLRDRRNYLIKQLKVHFADIATWEVPRGGFYIWLKIGPKINPIRLFNQALDKNVLLNPGILYDRLAGQYLRLSYSYASYQEMDQALAILRELIDHEAQSFQSQDVL